MTLHRLNSEVASDKLSALSSHIALGYQEYSLDDLIFKARLLSTFSADPTHFPIYRPLRCTARATLESLFDDLALTTGLVAQRLSVGHVVLEGPGVFASAWGARKSGYCSVTGRIWADSKARAEEVRATMLKVVGNRRVLAPTFTLDWHFAAGADLDNIRFEEIIQEQLHDEAYPMLGEPVQGFIDRYLNAAETVLIILGPPGGGKTRLVRSVLGEMSRRKGESAEIMYTCDKKALEGDAIYVNFITGSHDAFVVEDADHILTPRANGNVDLHRFLAIADGVIRAQGRKIIFTTNLPNVGDLDDALLRPGRCFAAIHTRSLTPEEATKLIAKLSGGDVERERSALMAVLPAGARSCSVASVYRAVTAAVAPSPADTSQANCGLRGRNVGCLPA
jgi:ATPase family associated with various cellular activities (AAA)